MPDDLHRIIEVLQQNAASNIPVDKSIQRTEDLWDSTSDDEMFLNINKQGMIFY